VDSDEHPRDGITAASLSRLAPVFNKDGTVTAGNSSGITDGAAAMLVLSEAAAKRLSVSPTARVVGYRVDGVAPEVMGIGPVPAVRNLLSRTGLALDEIDLVELNEAFAVQAIAVTRELGLDPDKVNVNGGAVALGHPIGASGARVLTTLLYALADRGKKRGVAALCLGGGNGVALAVELL
jgi:acetyl-CoA C-acetyltransferase